MIGKENKKALGAAGIGFVIPILVAPALALAPYTILGAAMTLGAIGYGLVQYVDTQNPEISPKNIGSFFGGALLGTACGAYLLSAFSNAVATDKAATHAKPAAVSQIFNKESPINSQVLIACNDQKEPKRPKGRTLVA